MTSSSSLIVGEPGERRGRKLPAASVVSSINTVSYGVLFTPTYSSIPGSRNFTLGKTIQTSGALASTQSRLRISINLDHDQLIAKGGGLTGTNSPLPVSIVVCPRANASLRVSPQRLCIQGFFQSSDRASPAVACQGSKMYRTVRPRDAAKASVRPFYVVYSHQVRRKMRILPFTFYWQNGSGRN